jgi:hypothetical protein
MTGRHLLSHSFTEKGQRKKIIDDHDKLCFEIEISKLLSNNKFSNTDINFSNISLMFVQIFQKLFQRRNFLSSLSELVQCTGMCIFQKTQTDKFKSKSKNRKKTKKQTKEKIYT